MNKTELKKIKSCPAKREVVGTIKNSIYKGTIYFNTVGYKFVATNGDEYYCDYRDFVINGNIITIKNNCDVKITLDA